MTSRQWRDIRNINSALVHGTTTIAGSLVPQKKTIGHAPQEDDEKTKGGANAGPSSWTDESKILKQAPGKSKVKSIEKNQKAVTHVMQLGAIPVLAPPRSQAVYVVIGRCRLLSVSREYKMPLCLTFIDLKKAFDSVKTEAVVEALDNQGVPSQYMKVLRELYSNFTIGILPSDKNIIIEIPSRNLRNAKVEMGRHGSGASAKRNEFDETCGCIGLHLNLQKTMLISNGWVSDAPFTLNGTNISECTSYVYLGRELNMRDDLTSELGRRRRAAWGAYKGIEDVLKENLARVHLFNITVLPALTYASEACAFGKQEENSMSVIERAIERVVPGVSHSTQVRDGIQSCLLRQ
ncbi:hypothetical protein RB195_002990 [Necator americanus]|uniref:Reverse transcriptase domain-containing protein n=1 Tax=Necator americanus TaxID=51031 RepID=A0ABR1DM88_NECAM